MRSLLTAVLLSIVLASTSSAAQLKALFDNSKAETAGNADWVIDDNQPLPSPDQSTITQSTAATTWNGAISSWGIGLVKRGWYVATLTTSYGISYQNANNPYDLSNYDVFIVPEPNIRFSSAESLAIVNYVKDGGGLIAISDHDIADRNNDGFDAVRIWDLLDRNHAFFGAHFDTTGDANNNITQTTTNVSTATADSLVFGPYGTVTGEAFHNGSTLTFYTSANSSVRGILWMSGLAHTSTTGVMAATATYGRGRIFMTCDSSPVDDGSAEAGNSSIYDGWGEAGATDSTLFLNATYWAARRPSGGDTQAPVVSVTSPAGGETWATGSTHTITWTATDNVGVTSVDLTYTLNNGTTWTSIATGLANTGSYGWTLPGTPSTQAKVRTRAHDAAGNVGSDSSHATFTIADQGAPSIAVTSPVGGETWATGSSHNITWTASDNVGVTAVDLEISTDNGGSWNPVASGLANTGSYGWTVPNTPSAQALVRATAHDAASNATQAASAAVFTIADQTAPTIALSSPVGGESWTGGSLQTIAWTATDNVGVDSVNVDYSVDGPLGPWVALAHGLANSGSLPWTLPDVTSDSALVRVTAFDHALNQAVAVSDSMFHIATTVDTPAQGPAVFALRRPAPNPSRGTVALRFSLAARGTAHFEVLDVTGRKVWQSETRSFEAGERRVDWNGQNAAGAPVPSGLYFARLVSSGGVRTVRLVRVQ